MAQFEYNPTDGFKNTASFPNPTTQEGGREQIQSLMDQARDAINAVDTDLQGEKEELAKTDGVGGSALIGTPPISGVSGATVKDQLASLKDSIDQTSLGQIADGSLTDLKLSDTAGQIKDRFSKHAADNLYQTAGGTATALTLTISETLANGLPITFIASANNNGAATTINGKSLYKPNTITAPTLISGKAYTVWYSSAGLCFFVKASAEGNTVAAHVLAGDTFSNDSDTGIVGTLQQVPMDVGNHAYSPGYGVATNADGDGHTKLYVRPKGYGVANYYYPNSDFWLAITEDNLISENIKKGTSILGQTGKLNYVTPAIPLTSGTVAEINNSASVTVGNGNQKIKETVINYAGTVRTSFTMVSQSGGSQACIYKNDVAAGTWRNQSGATTTTYVQDISVNAGDRLQVYGYANQAGQTVRVYDFKIDVGGSSDLDFDFAAPVS